MRFAARRGARRRLAEIPPPEPRPEPAPLPQLECPDDDREFVTWPRAWARADSEPTRMS